MKRYPGVIALGGFISGVCSFILVDRQQGMASWIAVIMLVSWLWLMLENSFTQLFTKVFKREIRRTPAALRHPDDPPGKSVLRAAVSFHHHRVEQWPIDIHRPARRSGTAMSIVDPLYYKWLAPKRWRCSWRCTP